jgi:hypothetical protein
LIERELTRKKYLLSLENRTPEQIAEEEALYIEIKRLEQNERKFKRDREDLLRTIAGIDSGLPDIVEDDGGPLGITVDTKKLRKKGSIMDMDSPATPSALSISTPLIKRPPTAKNTAYGTGQNLVELLMCLTLYTRCATLYHTNGPLCKRACDQSCPSGRLHSIFQTPRSESCHCSKNCASFL